MNSGQELLSVKSWATAKTGIAFHGTNVIFFSVISDGTSNGQVSCVKIYDENLSLKDSVTFQEAYVLNAMEVINNRLFISMVNSYNKSSIQVFDLPTNILLDPIQIPGWCWQLIPVDNDKFLAILSQQIITVDSKTLATSTTITAYVGSGPAAFNSNTKKLIYLRQNPQPSFSVYNLSSLDLVNGELTLLNGNEVISGPMVYDKKTQLIVSGPGVKVFSEKGEMLDHVETTAETKYIFVD